MTDRDCCCLEKGYREEAWGIGTGHFVVWGLEVEEY